jgi:hypothetical protein
VFYHLDILVSTADTRGSEWSRALGYVLLIAEDCLIPLLVGSCSLKDLTNLFAVLLFLQSGRPVIQERSSSDWESFFVQTLRLDFTTFDIVFRMNYWFRFLKAVTIPEGLLTILSIQYLSEL